MTATADLLRRAAARLRECANAASPGPWVYNSYSVVLSGPKIRPHDEWQDAQFAAGHTLERRGVCPACPESPRCALYTEDYRRDALVVEVPAHHGDTAIEHAAADATYIERVHPPVGVALAELFEACVAHADREGYEPAEAIAAVARAVLRENKDGAS
jgi:hypothetical protein